MVGSLFRFLAFVFASESLCFHIPVVRVQSR